MKWEGRCQGTHIQQWWSDDEAHKENSGRRQGSICTVLTATLCLDVRTSYL